MYANKLVCQILDYIDEHIEEDITIKKLEEQFYYNRTYIIKRFKRDLKISITTYINTIKIRKSLNLYDSHISILNIAFRSGFNSLEYYSEVFKKIIGVSPRIYKDYFCFRKSQNREDILTIRKSLVDIETIMYKINTYRNNKKPEKNEVKSLSLIFKQ